MSRNIAQSLHPDSLRVHGWRVLHGGNLPDLLAFENAGRNAGMTTRIATLGRTADHASACSLRSGSLITAWHEVREWREAFQQSSARQFDVVHAHSFAAGMAAVRNYPVVVYHLRGFVEQLAVETADAAHREPPGEWLSRSLRVAEQFVISRAGAVIVSDFDLRAGALQRGAAPDDVFVLNQTGESKSHDIAAALEEIYHHATAHARRAARAPQTMPLIPVST